MVKQKLEIPAVLVHAVDGVQYRVNGKIVDINESADTCSMKFRGYPVQDGIPMSSVYLNEGFIDQIKQYGRKAIDFVKKIVKKIGGFLFPVNEDGSVDVENFNIFANMCVAEDQGLLPECVSLYPSEALVGEAATKGVQLHGEGEEMLDSIDRECKEIETYWNRVMSTYVKNESMTVKDAVKSVNEQYYKPVKFWKSLNENTVASGKDPSDNMIVKDSVQLADWLYENIILQVTKGSVGHHSKTKPGLIWGAPGIGKTAIIRQAMDMVKKRRGLNLCFTQIACANLEREDLFLPKRVKNIANQEISGEMPKSWLPIYKWVENNPARMKEVDDFYNTGMFRYTREDFANLEDDKNPIVADENDFVDLNSVGALSGGKCGGIIFFDEFSRLPNQAEQSIMSLVNEHHLGGLTLASKWGFVCASNRTMDTLQSPERGAMESAMGDRFWHILYVPKIETWLKWARHINPRTGRQYVDEMILAFLETTIDPNTKESSVWWDCLDLGSRDNRLDQAGKDVAHTADKNYGWKEKAYDIQTDGTSIVDDPNTWTPRTWTEKIGDTIYDELDQLIFHNHPELYGEPADMQNIASLINDGVKADDMDALRSYDGSFDATKYYSEDGQYHCGIWTDGNIDAGRLKAALNQLSNREWNEWFNDKRDVIDPLGKYDRYTEFMMWISEDLMPTAVGKNALPVLKWRDYQAYGRAFTPDNIISLWETGKLDDPREPQIAKDDDYTSSVPDDYRFNTTYSQWKCNSHWATVIIDKIKDGFPGGRAGIAEMAEADKPKIQAALSAGIDDATYEKLYDKYAKKYSGKVNKTMYYYLFQPGGAHPTNPNREAMQKNIVITLETSKLARMLANFAMYVSKISIQMGIDNQLGGVSSTFPKWLKDACKDNIELRDWLIPAGDVTAADVEGGGSAQKKLVLSRTIWWPAMKIMSNAKNRDKKEAHKQ